MTITNTVTIHVNCDNTKGIPKNEIKAECQSCARETSHTILTRVSLLREENCEASDQYGGKHWYDRAMYVYFDSIQCNGCECIAFQRTVDDDSTEEIKIEIFPNPHSVRESIGYAHLLPEQVRVLYNETLKTLNNQQPTLCGIGIRALLETIAKEKNATGNTLDKKIEDLKERGLLTPENTKILHQLRTLGNDAAHEAKPHSDTQLGLAIDIIEHLLQESYILPELASQLPTTPQKQKP